MLHLKLTPLEPLVTRVRCHVTTENGSDSVKIEWDPVNDQGLVRYASLLRGQHSSGVRISCSADPSRHAVQGALNFAWQFEGSVAHPPGDWTNVKIQGARGSRDGTNQKADLIEVTTATNIELVDQEGPMVVTANQRALGLPSAPGLVDLAQVVTEIIVQRAEAEMMRVARRQLERALDCDGASKQWTKLCAALKTVRLEDAVTTIDTLVSALGQDMLDQARGKASTTGMKLAFELAAETLRGRRESLRDAAQRLVLAAAYDHKNFKTALAMALQGTSVDAARLRRIAESFDDRNDLESFAEKLAAATTVMKPTPESTESERLRVALTVVAWLTDPCEQAPADDLVKTAHAALVAAQHATTAGPTSVSDLPSAMRWAEQAVAAADNAWLHWRAADRLRGYTMEEHERAIRRRDR